MKKDCDLEVCVPVYESLPNNKNFKTFGGYTAVTAMHVGSHSKIQEQERQLTLKIDNIKKKADKF